MGDLARAGRAFARPNTSTRVLKGWEHGVLSNNSVYTTDIATQYNFICSFSSLQSLLWPGPRSVNLHCQAADEAGSEVVDECADDCGNAADEAVDNRTHDHR